MAQKLKKEALIFEMKTCNLAVHVPRNHCITIQCLGTTNGWELNILSVPVIKLYFRTIMILECTYSFLIFYTEIALLDILIKWASLRAGNNENKTQLCAITCPEQLEQKKFKKLTQHTNSKGIGKWQCTSWGFMRRKSLMKQNIYRLVC